MTSAEPTTTTPDRPPEPERRPVVGVTIGDPGGIGPEIVLRTLEGPDRPDAGFRVYGSSAAMNAVADRLRIDPFWWTCPDDDTLIASAATHDVVLVDLDRWLVERGHARDGEPIAFPHRPGVIGGALSFRAVDRAIADARRPPADPLRLDAIVTAPISKQAWTLARHAAFPDHTTLLGQRCHAKRYGMFFHAPRLNVMLATVHIPLLDLRNALTIGRVHDAIELAAEGCAMLGMRDPRIGVCGLNPHAGEAGLLGDEEQRLIAPAIEIAARQGRRVEGPFPADTIYTSAIDGRFDVVVAMYHDQGLIPVKLLAWDRAVNLTVGLPIIRTSPDHGTAFDLASRAGGPDGPTPDPGSMRAAVRLAVEIARRRATPRPPAGPERTT